jgi:hypothetical protein
MFVEYLDASARDDLRVEPVGSIERACDNPNPDIEPALRSDDYQTVEL